MIEKKSKRKITLFNSPVQFYEHYFLSRHAKNVLVARGNFSGIPSKQFIFIQFFVRSGTEGAS